MDLQEIRTQMPDIFEKVKQDVNKEIGRHRAGLQLGLIEMGMFQGGLGFIGGMFFTGGTMILMNVTPLRIIVETQSEEIVWAYTYHILLHEYLHSLGFYNESQVLQLTLEISANVFKDAKHPTVVIAKNGLRTYFPNLPLIYAPADLDPRGRGRIELLQDFDRSSYRSFYT
jgi:hypothetical protein